MWRTRFPPVTTTAADRDDNEAEHQIDRHDRTDLAELTSALGPVLAGHRRLEAAPWREIKVEKEQHHQDADPLHQMDVNAHPGKTAKHHKHKGVAAHQQQHDRGDHPGEEPTEDARPQQ